MIPYELISKKQAGEAHTEAEIREIINSFTDGSIPDYQMAAWLMAVYFNGMAGPERLVLVDAMLQSGRRLDFSHLDGFVADKHSTGGVGDKVSLILGPLVAACGIFVPMLSGHGLGHTGGTLDKLESIPGFRTALDLDTFMHQVADVGICIMGQTEDICPADRKMYALRDVTATVSSVPLIAGSIMSKKIAEGIQGLVLDVKWGNGAFMKTLDDARNLAEILTETGQAFDVDTRALISNMNQPLGLSAGIWCEVQEAVAALKGHGPADLMDLTMALSEKILNLAGVPEPAARLQTALDSGAALEKFHEMVAAQGGDVSALDRPGMHSPSESQPLVALRAGYINEIDTYRVGLALTTAGAGKSKKSDVIDPTAGLQLFKKIGDAVQEGEEIGLVFGADSAKISAAKQAIETCLTVTDDTPPLFRLIST